MLLKGDQRLLAINDIFGYNWQGFRRTRVQAYIGTDRAYRRMVPHPEPGSYGRPLAGKGRIGLLADDPGVHEDRPNEVTPHRKTPLHTPLGHEIPAQRAGVEIAVLERGEVGIALGDVGSGLARHVQTVV